MSELLERGFRVLEARADDAPYDLAVDLGKRFVRIQVRRAFLDNRKKVIVSLRKIYMGARGPVVRRYDESQIDFLVAVWDRKCWIFPVLEAVKNKSTLSLLYRPEFKEAWNKLTS